MAKAILNVGAASAIALSIAGIAQTGWGNESEAGSVVHPTPLPVIQPDALVAPASIWIDAPDFANLVVSPPNPALEHDPHFHENYYVWSVRGAPLADFTAPQNLLDEWNTPNRQFGKHAAFCLTEPGDYVIDLIAYDRSGNSVVANTATLTVQDPDDYYAGTKTVVLALDGDFTGAPAGARQETTLAAVETYLRNSTGTGAKRLLFKRGESVEIAGNTHTGAIAGGFRMDQFTKLNYIGAWGSAPQQPDLYPLYRRGACFDIWGGNLESFYTFTDVQMRYEWNPAESRGEGGASSVADAVALRADMVQTYNNVNTYGFATGIGTTGGGAGYSNRRVMAWNCTSTDYRTAAFYCAFYHNQGRFAVVGCRFGLGSEYVQQGKDLAGTQLDTSSPINLRIDESEYVIIRGNDGFSHGGSFTAAEALQDQPCLRLDSGGGGPSSTPSRYIISENVLEGGDMVIKAIGGDFQKPDPAGNWLIENNLLIATAKFWYGFITTARPGTYRNNIGISPNVADLAPNAGDPNRAIVMYGLTNPVGTALDEPFMIYNNTGLVLRTSANNGIQAWNETVLAYGVRPGFETQSPNNLTAENNLLHAPNLDTPLVDYAPIDTAQNFVGVAARYVGPRYGFIPHTVDRAGVVVPNGGSFTINYADVTDRIYTELSGTPTDQAYWLDVQANDSGNHHAWFGAAGQLGKDYLGEKGELSIDFSNATFMTITNTSGEDWTLDRFSINFDRKSKLPARDRSSESPTDVPIPRIVGAPNAAQIAVGDFVAFDDFFRIRRTGVLTKGALQPS